MEKRKNQIQYRMLGETQFAPAPRIWVDVDMLGPGEIEISQHRDFCAPQLVSNAMD